MLSGNAELPLATSWTHFLVILPGDHKEPQSQPRPVLRQFDQPNKVSRHRQEGQIRGVNADVEVPLFSRAHEVLPECFPTRPVSYLPTLIRSAPSSDVVEHRRTTRQKSKDSMSRAGGHT